MGSRIILKTFVDKKFPCSVGKVALESAGSLRQEKNRFVSELIKESKEVWQSNLKRKHDDDYIGNFNTEQFEKWFANMSAILASKYEP
ncbi:uncharacterized protein PITG_07811 [Phytophthora infestans T30-4]|uniref:Uncharacterized protein n=1 Tax=Phytophthora infestans (strain T30-4) TaxID=403677 RepID=D0N9V9_PHYIT|nr:uncharacterized protein PITG_07811 [Phytophthora infestans T30-4]EEY54213.1 hypothetical protein PITG_07811 [Phytophthora infestans T30-4]|eukprot:XP_002904035.1 hypothetical protein PITG_07811 [Phytophthora infestans T30-4]